MPLPLKHFYMIRHGQTEANAGEYMAGSSDSPLTDLGRQQAFEAQKVIDLLHIKPCRIHHSNLSRARDTAAIINEVLNVEMVEDPDLAEICAGDLEGAPWADCMDIFDGWVQTPGGEHPKDFFKRVKNGKTRAIGSGDCAPLIVCHGGVMRAFGALYGYDAPAMFKNAHLYEFTPSEGEFPWIVYDYELCEDTKVLKRNLSTIYELQEK